MDTISFDYQSYMNLLQDDDYIALYDYYSKETMLGILGVARQENPHSSFLRWLLDVNGDHGYGSIPLRKFINTVCLIYDAIYEGKACKNGQDNHNILGIKNVDILDEIKYGRYEIINQFIANEMVLKNQRRADIFCITQLKFQRFTEDDNIRNLVLLIENKIHSSEHDSQTMAYVSDLISPNALSIIKNRLEIDWLDKTPSTNNVNLYVFLNAFPTSEIKAKWKEKQVGKMEPFAESEDFITLNYQYLLDEVVEPLTKISSNEITRWRILDYIRCLGQAKITSMDTSDNNNTDNIFLIMAVSDHERKPAVRLWQKYPDVIRTVIESMFNKDKFILRNSERDFWMAMANLYRILEIDELKSLVQNANKRPVFTFNGNEYESRKKRNIGMLARDIICDFLQYQKEHGSDCVKTVSSLREAIQANWNSNWLREVILLDYEVLEIEKDYKSYKSKCTSKYLSESIEDFKGSFFSNEDQAINLGDEQLVYVAKYWSAEGISELIKILDHKYAMSYGNKVIKIA